MRRTQFHTGRGNIDWTSPCLLGRRSPSRMGAHARTDGPDAGAMAVEHLAHAVRTVSGVVCTLIRGGPARSRMRAARRGLQRIPPYQPESRKARQEPQGAPADPRTNHFLAALRETGDLVATSLSDARRRELRAEGAAMSTSEAITFVVANIDPKLLPAPSCGAGLAMTAHTTFGHGDLPAHRSRGVHPHVGAGSRRDEGGDGPPRRAPGEDHCGPSGLRVRADGRRHGRGVRDGKGRRLRGDGVSTSARGGTLAHRTPVEGQGRAAHRRGGDRR